jgi:rod shape determining protein RodA
VKNDRIIENGKGVGFMAIVAAFFRAALRFFREADMLLLILSTASTIFGIVVISSITANMDTRGANPVNVQIGAMIIGIILYILFSYVDIDIIADKSRFLFIFSILLVLTLMVWGEGEAGNRAWLRFFDIGIQPAEVTKVPFIIIIARMITTFRERKTLNSFMSLMQIFLVFATLFAVILLVSADMGTALIYVGILIVMLFAGGVKLRWFIISAVAITALMPVFWERVLTDVQKNRIIAPFAPELVDPGRTGVLWQVDRSVEAIATGGFLGQGLGNGRLTQTPGAIPALHTDFIFAAIGEEFGFIGCMAVILLLLAIIIRCVYVGIKSNNALGMLVCMGVAGLLITHAIENIGMTLGFMPVIGITLPFFSYGGSSIVTIFAAIGLVSGIKMRPKPVRFRNY